MRGFKNCKGSDARCPSFDAVTKENIRLKEALEHIAPTKLGGKDVVIVSMRTNMKVRMR